jgi:H+/Cl- antiporter ClcA
MHGPLVTTLAIVLLAVFVSADLVRTLQTGRARGRTGTMTKAKQPERYWRYVYASSGLLVLCAAALLWVMISPETFEY